MRADFQQYYNLNLDGMGSDYSVAHAAALCANLPRGARCFMPKNEDDVWSQDTWFLSMLEHRLRLLCWLYTNRGRDGQPPEMILPYKQTKKPKATKQYTSDEYEEILKRRRNV